MTPRQIIQQISERRRLHNIAANVDYLEVKKWPNGSGNMSTLVNTTDHEINKEIKQSKLVEFLAQGIGEPSIPSQCVATGVHTALGHYLQGNAIARNTREVKSSTRFHDSSKVQERLTSGGSITSSLYTTFKNAKADNQRANSQKMDIASTGRRGSRVDSWPKHLQLGMSNIRGMAKKIHNKSIAVENIIAANGKQRVKTESNRLNKTAAEKTKDEQFERHKATNREIDNRAEHLESTKRICVHIYVPTAEMNS